MLLAMVILPAGCLPARLGGDQTLEESANRLRQENFAINRENRELRAQLDDLTEEVRSLLQRLADPPALPEVDPDELPRLHRLVIGRYTSVIGRRQAGSDDTARIYLETRDQNDRFLPVAAIVELTALILPPADGPQAQEAMPAREPIVVGRRRLTSQEFADSYRSGLTGTHYTLDLPLEWGDVDPDRRGDLVTVQIELTEARTGQKFTRQVALRLNPPRPANPEAAEEDEETSEHTPAFELRQSLQIGAPSASSSTIG